MTTTVTFQPTTNTALDLTIDGNEVELTTREVDASGVVVTLPLPVLRATLDALAAEQDQPDVDMDGGVAAALIEQEVEGAAVCCGPLDEDVQFWHARWHEAADRGEARLLAAHLWKETARRLSKRARGIAWERDQYRAGEEEAEGRAEKAERERDDNVQAREEMIDRLSAALSEAREDLRRALIQRDKERAAQPCPLTDDDIADEMADRFIAAYMGTSGPVRDAVRAGLVAMHAEPPARPEWRDAPAVLVTIEGEERAFIKDPTREAWVDGIGSLLGTSIIAEHNPRALAEVGLTEKEKR